MEKTLDCSQLQDHLIPLLVCMLLATQRAQTAGQSSMHDTCVACKRHCLLRCGWHKANIVRSLAPARAAASSHPGRLSRAAWSSLARPPWSRQTHPRPGSLLQSPAASPLRQALTAPLMLHGLCQNAKHVTSGFSRVSHSFMLPLPCAWLCVRLAGTARSCNDALSTV